jgi:hypothetical protein
MPRVLVVGVMIAWVFVGVPAGSGQGLYRLYFDFVVADVVRTAAFTVTVPS